MGDTLWTHTYQEDSSIKAIINNVSPLPDGRIVVGAINTYTEYLSGYDIEINTPWFLVLDGMGNILKDTLYGGAYMVGKTGSCNELYPDMNGGYILIGDFDSVLTADPGDAQNFPAYIAHLDTNFRITWLTELPYVIGTGHRQACVMRQLHDSSYVLVGDDWDNTGYNKGFGAKIDRTGAIVWSQIYFSDSLHDAYLRDVVEKPDGGLVFTGATFNDTLPAWHQHMDMWLIETDSNGCDIAGCGAPEGVKPITAIPKGEFSVYPNPTNGPLTITTSGAGTFTLYTMLGQKITTYSITSGQVDIQLPINLAAGMYMGQFKPDDGGITKEVRLVYEQ